MLTILRFLDERKDLIRLIGGAIIGLVLGLIFAWLIVPVRWENASPGHLRSDFQIYYFEAVAEDYALDRDWDAARRKLGLDLKGRYANPWVNDPEALKATLEGVLQLEFVQEGTPMHRLATKIAEERGLTLDVGGEEAPPTQGKFSIWALLGLTLLVLAGVGAAFFLITRLRGKQEKAEPSGRAAAFGRVEEEPGVVEGELGPPLSSYKATYELGDDFFDPSFSIEREGEFLGECGIGISESIGVEDPKKVTALEAWLFDKSDIKTVTTVLASEYAYNDDALHAKLASKGKDVQVLPIQAGMETTLETTALRVRVRVKEVEYAAGNLPPNSYFARASVELRAWVKEGEPTAA
ncbi:MAG: hypothetical protein ACP5HM_08945 [Anaerolineae bacterium]